jgi:hypothetical protein
MADEVDDPSCVDGAFGLAVESLGLDAAGAVLVVVAGVPLVVLAALPVAPPLVAVLVDGVAAVGAGDRSPCASIAVVALTAIATTNPVHSRGVLRIGTSNLLLV